MVVVDQALRSVPMLATLGVHAIEATHDRVVLGLPSTPAVCDHTGAIHASAVFAVGELAASVALMTHPKLASLRALQQSTTIKYQSVASTALTATVNLDAASVEALVEASKDGERFGLVVRVQDGAGAAVAELLVRFTPRKA